MYFFTVLTVKSGQPGTALADFVIEWQDTSPVPPENSHFSRESVIELFILIRDSFLLDSPKETKRLSKSQKTRKTIENLKKI